MSVVTKVNVPEGWALKCDRKTPKVLRVIWNFESESISKMSRGRIIYKEITEEGGKRVMNEFKHEYKCMIFTTGNMDDVLVLNFWAF